jgi:hypothetical protein
LKKFLKDENGATAIEYGLIAALIVVAVIKAYREVWPEKTAEEPTPATVEMTIQEETTTPSEVPAETELLGGEPAASPEEPVVTPASATETLGAAAEEPVVPAAEPELPAEPIEGQGQTPATDSEAAPTLRE